MHLYDDSTGIVARVQRRRFIMNMDKVIEFWCMGLALCAVLLGGKMMHDFNQVNLESIIMDIQFPDVQKPQRIIAQEK
jgi:hypothetical protein